MVDKINENLKKLAKLTRDDSEKVDEKDFKKVKVEREKEARGGSKIPSYMTETSTRVERDYAEVTLDSRTSSGCGGSSKIYTLDVKGKTPGGRGFVYAERYSSRDQRSIELNKIKKDLEKLVSRVDIA